MRHRRLSVSCQRLSVCRRRPSVRRQRLSVRRRRPSVRCRRLSVRRRRPSVRRRRSSVRHRRPSVRRRRQSVRRRRPSVRRRRPSVRRQRLCAVGVRLCAVDVCLCAVDVSLCVVGVRLCAVDVRLCAVNVCMCAVDVRLCAVDLCLCAVDVRLCAPTTTERTTVVRRLQNTTQPSWLKSTGAGPKKKTCVTGNGQGSGLRSVKRKRLASIFATRFVHMSAVTTLSITGYLKSRLADNMPVKVDAIPTKFTTYASFHITCECDEPAIFMDPFLWPEDIILRWWRSPASSSSTASTAKSSKVSSSKSLKSSDSKSSSPSFQNCTHNTSYTYWPIVACFLTVSFSFKYSETFACFQSPGNCPSVIGLLERLR